MIGTGKVPGQLEKSVVTGVWRGFPDKQNSEGFLRADDTEGGRRVHRVTA